MEPLRITKHSVAGWSPYAGEIGFILDPMILRTGEIFLNGSTGTQALKNSFDVWKALHENLGGLLDFFDILASRDSIPLISYYDESFNPLPTSLNALLPDVVRPIEIGYDVYNEVKKGALLNLDAVDLGLLSQFGQISWEMDVFHYEWKPSFWAQEADDKLNSISGKFSALHPSAQAIAQFLLGGFIYSGFAQASNSMHYVQPKRARFLLGLTVAPRQAGNLSVTEEDAIFASAEARLKESRADIRAAEPIPPVLPYLLAQGNPTSVRDLLDQALAFRQSREGRVYRKVIEDIRADGIQARQTEDAVRQARVDALSFLAPYSKLDANRSRSLQVSLSAKTVGLPFVEGEAKTSIELKVPTWIRLWWNDNVKFGRMHKTLRRMWMAAESYNDVAAKLRDIWSRS